MLNRIREKVFIIAEIGVNHCGRLDLALELVDAAKSAGACAVKFQSFKADSLATKSTPKVTYQLRSTAPSESHYEMLKNLELSVQDTKRIYRHCENIGIEFLSTPYDVESARFLVDLGVKRFKTASADLVDIRLHQFIASTQYEAFISTGMSFLGDVERTLNLYRSIGNNKVTLMHAVSNYPCSDEAVNLLALNTLRAAFGFPVGLSDHSLGKVAAVAAVAMGAVAIEKHLTLDVELSGPDHNASLTPGELSSLVRDVRRAEEMLGSGEKICQPEEFEMAEVSRKSIFCRIGIREGEMICENQLVLKRPGIHLGPEFLPLVIGRIATRNIADDEPLRLGDFRDPLS